MADPELFDRAFIMKFAGKLAILPIEKQVELLGVVAERKLQEHQDRGQVDKTEGTR